MLTTRTMIILSAVAAAGIVFITEPSHSEQTVGVEHVKLQDRHPAFNVGDALRGALAAEREGSVVPAPVSMPKADRLNVVTKSCDSYTWPKIPAACLTVAIEETAKAAPRQVFVEDRADERISIVTPQAMIVAQH